MRNLKFRLWDELAGEITYVKTIHFYEEDGSLMGVESVDDDVVYFEEELEKRCSLMQYTGLKDKNGVEIYEGDIIEDSDKKCHVITFKNGGFGLRRRVLINYHTGEYMFTHEMLLNSVIDGCIVIGNIYENKELLEEE